MQRIAIIDYGMGNVRSVQKAIEFVSPDDEVLLTHDRTYIENSDRVVFPGQGAIGGCMKVLNELGLAESIKQAANEKPLLGICLGLQMLFIGVKRMAVLTDYLYLKAQSIIFKVIH